MELPAACWKREKTSVPFPVWRQCCNPLWIQAPPSPWLTFKEQKPCTTQIAAPFSMSGEKNHIILTFATLLQAEKLPKMLLTSVVKGNLASWKSLWNAGTQLLSFYPSRSSSFSAASPCKLLCKVTGKQKAAEKGDWSSSGFRRTAAPASTTVQILHHLQNKIGKWIKNTEGKIHIYFYLKHLTYLGG